MLNFTNEQLEAARAAKSPEELMAMVKEAGFELTLEQAEGFLLPPIGELADEELANVAGGGCGESLESRAHKDGRYIQVPFNCAYAACGKSKSMYARTQDEKGFHDVKCYACNKGYTDFWADGTVG